MNLVLDTTDKVEIEVEFFDTIPDDMAVYVVYPSGIHFRYPGFDFKESALATKREQRKGNYKVYID